VIAFNRRYTLDDRAESVYQYLPFEVPAEASGVTVGQRTRACVRARGPAGSKGRAGVGEVGAALIPPL